MEGGKRVAFYGGVPVAFWWHFGGILVVVGCGFGFDGRCRNCSSGLRLRDSGGILSYEFFLRCTRVGEEKSQYKIKNAKLGKRGTTKTRRRDVKELGGNSLFFRKRKKLII